MLLHGLARSDWSMRPLERRLEQADFSVENVDYDSVEKTPEELVADVGARVGACCREAARLHFVTHSLGGILVRAYLGEQRPANLGRVVMIAPPNKGSELADLLNQAGLLGLAMGPTAAELGTSPDSLPNRLGPADFELGVIAGTVSANPLETVIDGENDGTVSVESTKLEGMQDFIALPHTHTFIMRAEPVADQVLSFLRTGRFVHPSEDADQATSER